MGKKISLLLILFCSFAFGQTGHYIAKTAFEVSRQQKAANSGPTYDPDAQAFFDVETSLSTTIKDAVNALYTTLKSNGTFSKYQALWLMVGGTESSHKWNSLDPQDTNAAYRLTFNGTWTHDSNGAKGDGSTAWAQTWFYDTGFDVSTLSVGYYSNLDTGDATYYCTICADDPATGGGSDVLVQINDGAGQYTGFYAEQDGGGGNDELNMIQVVNDGILSHVIISGTDVMQNDIDGTNIPTPYGLNGMANSADGLSQSTSQAWNSPRRCALAYVASGLTVAEAITDYAAFQAFQTALGRNN